MSRRPRGSTNGAGSLDRRPRSGGGSSTLAILYGYFVDWKVEPRIGQRTPAFLSAGMRSVISDAQTQAKQPETEPLSSKRSPFKDPFRALRALAELRNVLRRGVDPVNAH